MPRSMILAVVCAALALASIAVGALVFVERPTVVTVAVPSSDGADRDLLAAASKVVRRGHQPIRFRVVDMPDAKAVAASLDADKVDMAIVRSDEAAPAHGKTVVILHRDAAILVAPGFSALKAVADLSGHTIGILDEAPGDRTMLADILDEADVKSDTVKVVALVRDGLTETLKSKTVDAVLVVGPVMDAKVQDAVRVVAAADDDPPVFLEIEEADAMAQRSAAYEKLSVVKGAFRGKPPRPDDDTDTISTTTRLLASSALSQSVVADVTRFFLNDRGALVAADPMARDFEEPSTDKGAALPAHPGSAAYIDDEEESFLDKYSDVFYLGAMLVGVLASGVTAVFSRLNAQGARTVDILTARLVEILKLVRFAPSLELVSGLETETDEIVAAALEDRTARNLDERRLGALGLALEQVREAIRDRRMLLTSGPVGVVSANPTRAAV